MKGRVFVTALGSEGGSAHVLGPAFVGALTTLLTAGAGVVEQRKRDEGREANCCAALDRRVSAG